jgi:NitT/TauT family transport system substrate-binding protein
MHRPTRIQSSRLSAIFAASLALASVAASCASAQTSALAKKTTISASRCASNRAAGTITYVSPFGYGPIPGILEMFVAQKLGYFTAVCENVAIVANSFNANPLVSAGTAQFTSTGSAADALASIAGGDNLVSIATLADSSSYVLLTHPGITKLTQLNGKILGYHAPLPVMIIEMLAKAGTSTSKMTLINDQTYDPTLLPRGRFDALQAYQVNEPLTLKADHLPFKEWYPKDFGIKGTFNVVTGNSTFVKKHPTATADFLRAELHAIDYCENHVAQCVKIESDAATSSGGTFDTAHATAEWKLSVSLMKQHALAGKGIGVQSIAEWRPEATALRTFKVLSSLRPCTAGRP